MGLVRVQRVGEGMHIKGRGRSIDMTISIITGEKGHKKVKFRVEGIANLDEFELSADDGLVTLFDDIGIQVGTKDYYEIAGDKIIYVPNKVRINYDAPEDYKLQRKEYKDRFKKHLNKKV